jgi:hypothetical protein
MRSVRANHSLVSDQFVYLWGDCGPALLEQRLLLLIVGVLGGSMSRFAIALLSILLIAPFSARAGVVDDETDIETEGLLSDSEGAQAAAKAREVELKNTRAEASRLRVADKLAVAKANSDRKRQDVEIAKAEAEIGILQTEMRKLEKERKIAEALNARATKRLQDMTKSWGEYKRQNAELQAEIDKQHKATTEANRKSAIVQQNVTVRQAKLIAQKRALQQTAAPPRSTAAAIPAAPIGQ